MEITKRKYITTITYDKICNGVKNSCRESFFDKKYVDIRVDEINNCEYDKEYRIDQNTLFLDFIDIYLKKELKLFKFLFSSSNIFSFINPDCLNSPKWNFPDNSVFYASRNTCDASSRRKSLS